MNRFLRPVAALGVAAGVTMAAGMQLATEVSASPHMSPVDHASGRKFTDYDLAKLKILEPTLYHIEESYVEPGRIDWEAMYVAGVEAVERRVPACKFSREVDGNGVSLEIGEFRTVMEVARVGSSRQLRQELRRVATLLKEHLHPAQLGGVHAPDSLADIEYAMVNGILDTLDPHSILLPPPDATEMDVENQGEFGGLGVTIVEREGWLVVEYPIPDTPAQEAGILKGDRIVRIDGELTINMSLDDAVVLLRGPVGEPVVLEIERESFDAPRRFELVRKLIKLNEVDGELIEGDIGLIHIQSFHSNVESELHAVLTRLHRESQSGLDGVILDLRDNPGGYLNQAVAVADTFLERGEIVSTIDGNGRKQDVEEARSGKTEPDYPIVVLMNSNSASASEIVGGALRNNERAVIVGERSFGKGSVQNLHQFFDDSKLKLTISKYLTPGDKSIQAVGIPADVELVPVRIEADGETDKNVLMYWRERVRREADLDLSLEQTSWGTDETAYRIRYVDELEMSGPRGLHVTDFQVQFAKDLILAAGNSRRAEMLANAGRVVDTHVRRGRADVVEALDKLGIDWTAGSAWSGDGMPVEVVLDLGSDGDIDAGVRETVTLVVTNISPVTLFQVGAVATENEVLAGREFLFGRLDPGESRRHDVTVNLVDGYPAEHSPVTFEIRDVGAEPIGEVISDVRVEGRDLPELAWTWAVTDSRIGDGDGIAETGEILDVDLTVENRGTGWSGQAFARIKNRNGRALDILVGTLEPGTLADLDGKPCPEVSRASGCQKRLAPGARWSGRFEVELKEERPEGWDLDLTVGDGEAYDHASIVRAGFYEHFSHRDKVHISSGVALPAPHVRQLPAIEISRAPSPIETVDRVSVSGLVTDDSGIRHVIVYAAGDKLFYEGSSGKGVGSVPFTADVTLESGTNLITIVAEDTDGFTSTRSVVVYHRTPEPPVSKATPTSP